MTSNLDIMPTVLAAAGPVTTRPVNRPAAAADAAGAADAADAADAPLGAARRGDARAATSVEALADGERVPAATLDGHDIGALMRPPPAGAAGDVLRRGLRADADGGDGDGDGGDGGPNVFLMHYCNARVAAVRHGRFKLHFTTAEWQDEQAQTCRAGVICGCHGHEHDPPLLFDLHADPAELAPLDASAPRFRGVLARVGRAKARHEASVAPVQSQTELLPRPWHFPCCGEEPGSWAFAWGVLTNQCGC